MQQTPGRLLLRVAEANNNRVDKYQYDQQGQVIKFFYYRGVGRDTAYQDYTYKNNLLHKISHYNADFTEYFYEGNVLKKTEINDDQIGVTYYVDYTYREGKVYKEYTYYRYDGQWELEHDRTYNYDANGNVQKITRYLGPDLLATIEYSGYSDHPDPIAAIEQQKYRQGPAAMPRLAGKEVHYDEFGDIEWTTEYTYEYDGKGYPVKRDAVYRNPDNYVLARSIVFYSYSN